MMIVAMALVLLLSPPKPADPPPRAVLVPVPGYVMMEGDVLQLYLGDGRGKVFDVAVAGDPLSFRDAQKAIMAGDDAGLAELVKEHYVVMLPTGTRVRVLKRPLFAPPEYPLSAEPGHRNVEVRILDGPKAGKTAHVIYEMVRLCRTVQPKAKKKGRR